ncbi:MAG: twin-arginine translocase subunit TatB [Bacteroidetes bacterium HGW-Bacteroidetes-3]|nr:MAG: twin-arginine translocase subunit TatB [Bacteroidetes bacterium HGW-Bacteroidetes-3]
MFDIGLSEIVIILIVALIVIGPKKLPEVARALGRGLAEFRRALDDVKEELKVDEIRSQAEEMKDSLLYGKGFNNEEEKPNPAEKSPPEQAPGGAEGKSDQESRTK